MSPKRPCVAQYRLLPGFVQDGPKKQPHPKVVANDEKEKIFERGFGKHTGMGLFLSQEILAITGLSLKETGIYGSGVRFEIEVPEGSYRLVPDESSGQNS